MPSSVVSGIVLSSVNYRENDLIVKVLGEDGVFSVLARGTKKQTSKNRSLTSPFSVVELEYDPRYSRELYYLIKGRIVQDFQMDAADMESVLLCQLITRFLLTSEFEKGFYPAFVCMLEGLQNRDWKKVYFSASWLAMHFAAASGTGLNLSECTVCASREHIFGLSLDNGGFVCKDHVKSSDLTGYSLLKRLLLLSRFDFQSPYDWYTDYEWDRDLFLMLISWYADSMDLRRNEIEFFQSLCKG